VTDGDRRQLLRTIDRTLGRAYLVDHAAYVELLQLRRRLERQLAADSSFPHARAA
jgi:hypothetical protein